MPKISKKTRNTIYDLLSKEISLANIQEFDDFSGKKLFECPPDAWNDLEKTLCDYQGRISNELITKFNKLFYIR